MKRICFLALLFTFVGVYAQKDQNPSKALKSNNIEAFAITFGKTIDLNIPTAKANYSNNQAKILVENFFKSEPLVDYSIQHNGGGNGRPKYEIGKLTTQKSNYRTYILYQVVEAKIQIIEFRIEKE